MVQGYDNFTILYSGIDGNPNTREKVNEYYRNKKWFSLLEIINMMLLDGCFRWFYKTGLFCKETIGNRRNGNNCEREVDDEKGTLKFTHFFKDR